MKIDCLVAEIGSTTTIVSAFMLHQKVAFLGRGYARTSVEIDVTIGLNEAIEQLRQTLGVNQIEYDEMFASSSAAGGLKMTVHGLVYEMTAKAAKEAALNAGANIHLVTANRLEDDQVEEIKKIAPKIIIIAGGTDYGEKEVAYQNLLKVKDLGVPMIYTGNIANHKRIEALQIKDLKIVENVYPRVDDFNIIPLRQAIYETFEKNIIHAKGMHNIFNMVTHTIIPTPGAVMDATLLLAELIDGVMTIDVGGATTDVHSISEPKPEFAKYSEGEPKFKRTVEGDLGVYVNRHAVIQTMKEENLQMSKEDALAIVDQEPFIPFTTQGKKLIDLMTRQCVHLALDRHIGDLRRIFTTNGIKVIPDGKDASQVRLICLTGGALIHHEDYESVITSYLNKHHTKLVPDVHTKVLLDRQYLFAAIGVISHHYKKEAIELLKMTLGQELIHVPTYRDQFK
jgi:uncharacterized protein (TIGR01319 family)